MSAVYGVIRKLGATSKYKGYYYVVDAVEMAQKIYERPVKVTKDIYPVIARGKVTPLDQVSNDQICAFEKTAENMKSVMIVINTSGSPQTVDLSGQKDYDTLSSVLTTTAENITLDGNKLTLPAYDIAVLTQGAVE